MKLEELAVQRLRERGEVARKRVEWEGDRAQREAVAGNEFRKQVSKYYDCELDGQVEAKEVNSDFVLGYSRHSVKIVLDDVRTIDFTGTLVLSHGVGRLDFRDEAPWQPWYRGTRGPWLRDIADAFIWLITEDGDGDPDRLADQIEDAYGKRTDDKCASPS